MPRIVPAQYTVFLFATLFCLSPLPAQDAQLLRTTYTSTVDDLERDCFLYLPTGYNNDESKAWPVLLYLHGDGYRGDGKEDLDYLLGIGPLYEAWIQKRDLPFIIVAPQLHMFGRDGEDGPDYIKNRTREGIPQRLEEGLPRRPQNMPAREWYGPMQGALATKEQLEGKVRANSGWRLTNPDLIQILDTVIENYRANDNQVYLAGSSMGGFGTWYYASKYPERFAAILSVVAFPTVNQATAIAEAGVPAWVFSGGRDPQVETKYFFLGMNKLDELGAKFRFTTEQDMFHNVWNRVYAGEDIYNWLLQFQKE